MREAVEIVTQYVLGWRRERAGTAEEVGKGKDEKWE